MATDTEHRGQLVGYANRLGEPRIYLPIALAVLVSFVPFVMSSFFVHIFILMFITGTGAIAWNIIGGFGGQFSLGNAMFLGIGGYSTGILLVDYGQSAWVGIAVGVVLAVVLAVVVGYPAFKLSGHYFALATIAVVEGLWYLSLYFRDITRGSTGFSVVAEDGFSTLMFSSREPYFYLAYLLFLSAFVVSIKVRYSRIGYYLLAIRENEDAAEAIGIDTAKYKLYGFVISAILTAIAGGIYAVYINFLYPDSMFSLDESLLYALVTLIGGTGTIAGPIIGTALLVPLEQYATTVFGGDFGALSYIVYGMLLIAFIMYAPEGLVDRLSYVGEYIEDVAPSFSIGDSEK